MPKMMPSTRPRGAKAKPTKPAKPTGVAVPVVKAAAWASSGVLHAVVARGATFSTIAIRDGRAVDERPAVARASRIVALDSGAVLTMAQDGKAKLVGADGEARSAHLAMAIADLVACHGVAYAAGPGRQLARFDEASATWTSAGLRVGLEMILPEEDGGTDDLDSVVEGRAGPIAAVHANSYHRVLVMEHDGASWRLRADLPYRSNALAWRPDGDVVYSVGDEVHAITAAGAITKLGDGDDRGLWSSGWARGRLYAATLASVERIDTTTGESTELLPWGKGDGEVPHNHSLFVRDDGVAFVRAGKLYLLDGDAFTPVALR